MTGDILASQRGIEIEAPPPMNTGKIPLAIARMYKLQMIDEDGALQPPKKKTLMMGWKNKKSSGGGEEITNLKPVGEIYSVDEIREIEWTTKQLRTVVTAIFPSNGGRVERSTDPDDVTKEKENPEEGPRYEVYNKHGTLLRKFVVTKDGKVMQVIKRESNDDDDDGKSNSDSIKLGLVRLFAWLYGVCFVLFQNCKCCYHRSLRSDFLPILFSLTYAGIG